LLGVWLRGSYKQSPTGASLVVTDVLIGATLAMALVGAVQLLRTRQPALAAWFASMLVALLVLSISAATWVQAKTLMLSSPDFVYPPPALAHLADGYGRPVQLDRAAPAALLAYPLIITRRDPSASPPPVAYRLAWQGASYSVWSRPPGAAPALAHLPARGSS